MRERKNRTVTVIFDPASVTVEFEVWIRRNYGETVGVNRSAAGWGVSTKRGIQTAASVTWTLWQSALRKNSVAQKQACFTVWDSYTIHYGQVNNGVHLTWPYHDTNKKQKNTKGYQPCSLWRLTSDLRLVVALRAPPCVLFFFCRGTAGFLQTPKPPPLLKRLPSAAAEASESSATALGMPRPSASPSSAWRSSSNSKGLKEPCSPLKGPPKISPNAPWLAGNRKSSPPPWFRKPLVLLAGGLVSGYVQLLLLCWLRSLCMMKLPQRGQASVRVPQNSMWEARSLWAISSSQYSHDTCLFGQSCFCNSQDNLVRAGCVCGRWLTCSFNLLTHSHQYLNCWCIQCPTTQFSSVRQSHKFIILEKRKKKKRRRRKKKKMVAKEQVLSVW